MSYPPRRSRSGVFPLEPQGAATPGVESHRGLKGARGDPGTVWSGPRLGAAPPALLEMPAVDSSKLTRGTGLYAGRLWLAGELPAVAEGTGVYGPYHQWDWPAIAEERDSSTGFGS